MAIESCLDAAETGDFEFGLPADDLRIVGIAGRFKRSEFLECLDDHARAGLGFEPSIVGRQHGDGGGSGVPAPVLVSL